MISRVTWLKVSGFGAGVAYLCGVLRGLALAEVHSLLQGETDRATIGEAPALILAQHHGRTEGIQRLLRLLRCLTRLGLCDTLE